MPGLFVDKWVEIHAAVERVWHVLTSRDETQGWASEFTAGGPTLYIESEWVLGSTVVWKDRRGRAVLEGVVTAVETHRLLRFTAIDVVSRRPAETPQGGITFKLTERETRTVLWVSQGDFSTMPDGAKYRELSAELWDHALARIKRLAERGASTGH